MRQIIVFGSICFLLLSFESCKKKPKDDRGDTFNTGAISIACDENFRNMMNAMINAFEAHNELTVINPIYSNENEVIRLLLEDSVRLALVTRELNLNEQKASEEKRMIIRKFLVAFDGIALIINKANPDSLIGLPTIRKILTGEITNWSQINPHSSPDTIRVLFESAQSGVLRYISDSITKGAASSPYLYAMNSSDELIRKVCELPNTIGIIGFNIINDEALRRIPDLRDQFRIMRVGKEEQATLQNTYLPYAGDIRNNDYPFWRPIYVLLSDPRSGLSSGFSIFIAHDVGQMVILKSGLLPAVTEPQNRSVYVYPKEETKRK